MKLSHSKNVAENVDGTRSKLGNFPFILKFLFRFPNQNQNFKSKGHEINMEEFIKMSLSVWNI